MKKIVFDCERMKYPDTGIYHYCLNLGKELERMLQPPAAQLTIYCPGNATNIFSTANNVIVQNSLHKFCLPRTGQYDIWHATYQSTDYLPRRNRKIKVVLTIHDLNFIHDQHKTDSKKLKHLKHLRENIYRSDAIVCISEFCKSDVLKYCDTGNKPVHVIHNGTNQLSEPVLLPHSYKPFKKFLFSIGVVNRKKNFHTLLPLLEKNDMELLIAGKFDDPDYLSFLMKAARSMGVENKLQVLGTISETEKSWYFKNCYAFASPSTAEGFCMPVTEAMSVGKPLFLSGKTALPEIGGKVAFYFPDFTGSTMQDTFSNGMRQYALLNMENAIKKRGLDFCWEKAARKYMEVYESL